MIDHEHDEGPARCESINRRSGVMCEAYHGHDGDHWFGLSERWADAPATVDASAPANPGEGHRTGTGGPDAPGASEGLALASLVAAVMEAGKSHGWGIIPHDDVEFTLRIAEPILRQAVAEQIARRIEATTSAGQTVHDAASHRRGMDDAAEIAREVGRG